MPEPAPEVERFVRDWLDAKMAGDAGGILAGLSGYDGALGIGTDAGEWLEGQGFADGHAATEPFGAELELVEEAGGWRIVQSHVSVPADRA
jgi:hypothetical protein